jgi:hypothetical protein
MTARTVLVPIGPARAVGLACLLFLLPCLAIGGAGRADEPKTAAPREVVGKATLLSALLHREGADKTWRVIRPGAPIYSEDLIVAVPVGGVVSGRSNVRLQLLSDLARLSPYPVLESAVILHANPEVDLDFTLDRGRVDVALPAKGKGPAKVRVQFHKQKWDLTLNEPGTRVALELYGRWPQGVPFHKPAGDAKNNEPAEEPTADLVLLVIQGSADLDTGTNQFALHEPPGPAYFHWDSVGGADANPTKQETVPPWARPAFAATPAVQATAKDLVSFGLLVRQLREGQAIEDVLSEALTSESATIRKIAVYGLGAVDDLPHLVDALSNPKHADVRNTAVSALRAWIGRGPGQDLKLFDALVKDKKLSASQATIVMQLLHSFSQTQRRQPATYSTLIDYLSVEPVAIRQLASWHLVRLAPQGAKIGYDPAGPEADREKAVAEWKKLIPEGQLPPTESDESTKPKPKDK